LKEEYYEGFTVLLTIMAYGEQDTIMNFIHSTMNLDIVKVIQIGRLGWLGRTGSLQKAYSS